MNVPVAAEKIIAALHKPYTSYITVALWPRWVYRCACARRYCRTRGFGRRV